MQAPPQQTGSDPHVPLTAQPLSSLTGAGGHGAGGRVAHSARAWLIAATNLRGSVFTAAHCAAEMPARKPVRLLFAKSLRQRAQPGAHASAGAAHTPLTHGLPLAGATVTFYKEARLPPLQDAPLSS